MTYQVECSLEYIPFSISLLVIQYIALACLATNIQNGDSKIAFRCDSLATKVKNSFIGVFRSVTLNLFWVSIRVGWALAGLHFQTNHIGGFSE